MELIVKYRAFESDVSEAADGQPTSSVTRR
jgi:hypothetical protein